MQPIPIHTVPQSEDGLLLGYNSDACPQFATVHDALMHTKMWLAKEKAEAPLLQEVENVTATVGLTIDNVRAIG